MTVQEIIRSLREKHGLSQDQLAERVMVTRQAVSRWETGKSKISITQWDDGEVSE